MSKFVVFSDMHLHQWNYGANYSSGINSRLQAQKDVLQEIWLYCMDHQIKNVFFCGDMFHTHGRMDAACVNVFSSFVIQLTMYGNPPTRLNMLVGNHDMADKSGRVNSISPFMGYENLAVVSEPGLYPPDRFLKFSNVYCSFPNTPNYYMSFMGIPYLEDKDTLQKALNELPEGMFVFMHQGVSGVSVGSDFVIPNEILTPDMIPSHVKHAFTGHYHSHKKVSDKLTIVGAPMQHTWADSGEDRGWLVVDSETGEYERVLSKAPRFVKLGPFEKCEAVSGNYIKLMYDVEESEKEYVRRDYINKGALSVEFTYQSKELDKQVRKSDDNFNLNDVIKKYQDAKGIDEKGIKIGEQLRQGTYEVNTSS